MLKGPVSAIKTKTAAGIKSLSPDKGRDNGIFPVSDRARNMMKKMKLPVTVPMRAPAVDVMSASRRRKDRIVFIGIPMMRSVSNSDFRSLILM